MKDRLLSEQSSLIEVTLPITYSLQMSEQSKLKDEVIILLHGFQDRGQRLWRNLHTVIPEEITCLIPNGLFPVPVRLDRPGSPPQLKLAYGWYFYNSFEKTYHIDQTPACQMLLSLLEKLQLLRPEKKFTIIGFSQGGYLAPFLGLKLSQQCKVANVLIINGEIKTELLAAKKLPFSIHAIHGAKDQLVDPINCQNSFNKFIANGNQGTFDLLENSEHDIDQDILKLIKKYI